MFVLGFFLEMSVFSWPVFSCDPWVWVILGVMETQLVSLDVGSAESEAFCKQTCGWCRGCRRGTAQWSVLRAACCRPHTRSRISRRLLQRRGFYTVCPRCIPLPTILRSEEKLSLWGLQLTVTCLLPLLCVRRQAGATFIEFGNNQVSAIFRVSVNDPESQFIHCQIQVGVWVQTVNRLATGSR